MLSAMDRMQTSAPFPHRQVCLPSESPLLQEQEAAGDSLGRWLSPQSPADSTAPPPATAHPSHPPAMLLSPLRVPRCGVEAIPVH